MGGGVKEGKERGRGEKGILVRIDDWNNLKMTLSILQKIGKLFCLM